MRGLKQKRGALVEAADVLLFAHRAHPAAAGFQQRGQPACVPAACLAHQDAAPGRGPGQRPRQGGHRVPLALRRADAAHHCHAVGPTQPEGRPGRSPVFWRPEVAHVHAVGHDGGQKAQRPLPLLGEGDTHVGAAGQSQCPAAGRACAVPRPDDANAPAETPDDKCEKQFQVSVRVQHEATLARGAP